MTIAATKTDSSPRHLKIPGLGSGSSLTTTVAPGAAHLYETDGSGDGSEGAAVVTSDSVLSVSEILSNTNSGNPVSESTVPGLSDYDIAAAYMIPADTVGVDTGIALYNPGSDSATIKVQLIDSKGKTAKTETVTLSGQHHTTIFATAAPLDAKTGFRGTINISSSAPVAAAAVRRSSVSSAYTLLPAANAPGHGLQFLLPGIADGRTGSETSRTTFLLTNLSTATATVQLALTRDDGTPFKVHLAPGGTNSSFQSKIGPGVSVFLETDGSETTTVSGTAAITSTQPLAASAVVSNTDTSGAATETSLTPATMFYQFMLPFDEGSKTNAAARFYNASSQPVTLTLHLNDVEGKPVATKELPELGAGQSVTGTVARFFGSAHATKGSLTVYSGSPVNLLMSAVAVRQTSKAAMLSSTPGVVQFGTGSGTPRTVTPTLDTANQATADINATGGSLSVSDAKGNHFTLTIPPGALLDRTSITMTAISSATGLAGPGLVAGVELEPDGLPLFAPALLKIDLANSMPDGVMPIGWRGDTPGVYVNSVLPDPKSLTISLTHFSGAGLGGIDLTSDLLFIDNKMDLLFSTAGELLGEDRQAQLLGMDGRDASLQRDIQTLFAAGYPWIISKFMQLAENSQDADVIRCALIQVLGYERQRQLLGETVGVYAEDDPISVDVKLFVSRVSSLLISLLTDRCKQHDFTVYSDLLAAYRQFSLLGFAAPEPETQSAILQSCLPQLELDYNSEMTGVINAHSAGNINWDATIQGSLIVTGEFLNNELTYISVPSQDLFTSFELHGSGHEIYNTPSLFFPPGPCTESIQSKTASTMTVQPINPNTTGDLSNSRIQFQFDPHYDPAAKDLKDQQLCSFCPVYRKKPVKVELYLDPGLPNEVMEQTCPDTGTTITPQTLWLAGWSAFHYADPTLPGLFQNWDLPNTPDLLAHKAVPNHTTDQSGFLLTEQTDLKLKPCTGPTMTDANGQQTCTGGSGGQTGDSVASNRVR